MFFLHPPHVNPYAFELEPAPVRMSANPALAAIAAATAGMNPQQVRSAAASFMRSAATDEPTTGLSGGLSGGNTPAERKGKRSRSAKSVSAFVFYFGEGDVMATFHMPSGQTTLADILETLPIEKIPKTERYFDLVDIGSIFATFDVDDLGRILNTCLKGERFFVSCHVPS